MTRDEETEALAAVVQARHDRGSLSVALGLLFVGLSGDVHAQAVRNRHLDLEHEDLMQAGYMGLARAAERFKAEAGFRFRTYAAWWIRSAMQREAQRRGRRVVRLPSHIHERRATAARAERRLAAELHRAPTRAEIAAACGLTLAQLERARGAAVRIERLGAPRSVHDPRPYELQDESGPDAGMDPADVRAAVEALPERLRVVVRLRFGFDGPEQTLRAAAVELGVSRETVRTLQATAMERLREHFGRVG